MIIAIGCGGGAAFIEDMARAGVRYFLLIDPDVIDEPNLATQQAYRKDVGKPKVEVLKERLIDTRVLIIYDKAGIDFDYWDRCRRECAVYFISRVKENMVFEWSADSSWDESDARNAGVFLDCKVRARAGQVLRLIMYQDPLSGTVYEFLTNEPDLPPGVVAELYRRRWEAEKVFDELKNKLGQKKAWATSLVAKESQALLIAITHNLLIAYEQNLEDRHRIRNTAEDERRCQRAQSAERTCARAGQPISSLVLALRRATQRSLKFIRWLRHALRERLAEAAAVAHLRQLYAVL